MLFLVSDDRKTAPESGRRLRLLRIAYGKNGPKTTQEAFAAQFGFSKTRYGNYESGWPLPRDAALAISQKLPGINVSWLYSGDPELLSGIVRNDLASAEAWLATSDKRRAG